MRWWEVVALLALVVGTSPGIGGATVVGGTEFVVNSYAFPLDVPDVCRGDLGAGVAVWESSQRDGSQTGVFGQRFDAAGAHLGTEFQVNTYTFGMQHAPRVACRSDGSFLVAWQSTGQDGHFGGIFAQTFDSAGQRVASELAVNTYTGGFQTVPDVAAVGADQFLVVWHDAAPVGSAESILARRVDTGGSPVAPPFSVTDNFNFSKLHPAVAANAAGESVVVWTSVFQEDLFGVYGKRYDSAGSARGSEFQINTFTIDRQYFPAVCQHDDGGFVATWESFFQDGGQIGAFAQRFASDGTPAGPEFQVNTFTTYNQRTPDIACAGDGQFVIVWTSTQQDGFGEGVFGKRFDRGGVPDGAEFQVATHTLGHQQEPAVAVDADGDIAVVWQAPQIRGRLLSLCENGAVGSGESCDDGNDANGDCCSTRCQYEPNGSACTSDGSACTTDSCNAIGTCLHLSVVSGTVCRSAAGGCDMAETCDGGAADCPADLYLSGVDCRSSGGVCDLAESCDGSGPACPPDDKRTAECRAAAGACDAAESCDGSNDDCPADALLPSGTLCRSAAGNCDVADACSGSSPGCPDVLQPDGAGCDDGDACTDNDHCDGAGTCIAPQSTDCDDGDACTVDSCNPSIGCVNDGARLNGCLTAERSLLLVKQHASDDGKDKLIWKWLKGDALEQADLAEPTTSARYGVCIYAGAGGAPVATAMLPPGSGWRVLGSKGYKFSGASPDGLSKVMLKGGSPGRSKAQAKGKGAALADPTLPFSYPVTVQLRKDGSPLCLESTFTVLDAVKNDATQFTAKQ